MKILLVTFNHYSKRYHTNENISEMKLLLVTFLKSLIIDIIKHVTISKNGISLYTFLKKFNNRHALCIRLIGLNK